MAEEQAKEKTVEAPAKTPVPQGNTNPLAIAALIVGIVAVISGWIPFWGLVAGAAAIVLGIMGLKKSTSKGMSIAGIITGAVGALWSLIVTVIFIIAIGIFGASAAVVGDAIQEQHNQQQQLVDAKKEFSKGETADFGKFEVKVNNVTRDYQAKDGYSTPRDGYEYILVNMTVKNTDSSYNYVSGLTFDVEAGGLAASTSYIDVENELVSGDLASGASLTGNVAYEVPKGASNLKLIYKDVIFHEGQLKDLVYKLDI